MLYLKENVILIAIVLKNFKKYTALVTFPGRIVATKMDRLSLVSFEKH